MRQMGYSMNNRSIFEHHKVIFGWFCSAFGISARKKHRLWIDESISVSLLYMKSRGKSVKEINQMGLLYGNFHTSDARIFLS